jgi:hypothetical protein
LAILNFVFSALAALKQIQIVQGSHPKYRGSQPKMGGFCNWQYLNFYLSILGQQKCIVMIIIRCIFSGSLICRPMNFTKSYSQMNPQLNDNVNNTLCCEMICTETIAWGRPFINHTYYWMNIMWNVWLLILLKGRLFLILSWSVPLKRLRRWLNLNFGW